MVLLVGQVGDEVFPNLASHVLARVAIEALPLLDRLEGYEPDGEQDLPLLLHLPLPGMVDLLSSRYRCRQTTLTRDAGAGNTSREYKIAYSQVLSPSIAAPIIIASCSFCNLLGFEPSPGHFGASHHSKGSPHVGKE